MGSDCALSILIMKLPITRLNSKIEQIIDVVFIVCRNLSGSYHSLLNLQPPIIFPVSKGGLEMNFTIVEVIKLTSVTLNNT